MNVNRNKSSSQFLSHLAIACIAIVLTSAGFARVTLAQNIRGSATGPTTAKGYDHAGQYLHVQDVKPADNMYPVVQHPEQDAAARQNHQCTVRPEAWMVSSL